MRNGRAIAGYQAKVEAFNEASATVKEARRKEESAHDSLQSALKMTKSLPEALVPQGWAWAPLATGRDGPRVRNRFRPAPAGRRNRMWDRC